MLQSNKDPLPDAVVSVSCPLLELAAELRNSIYELAFTLDDDNGIGVLLEDAAGPSKALLLTCRQIYSEARIIHKQAYQCYWRQTLFIVRDQITKFRALTEEDLDAIKNVILFITYAYSPVIEFYQTNGDGVWIWKAFESLVHIRAMREDRFHFLGYETGKEKEPLIIHTFFDDGETYPACQVSTLDQLAHLP